MSRRAALMLMAALCGPVPGAARAQMLAAASSTDAARIRAIVGAPAGASVPGCAVGLFHNGGGVFVDAGAADIATGRRMDADTLFYSGSLAKQFTALAIMQLVVKGRLRLEDDVRKFLPEMRRVGPVITVAMLLHHTAGVPNDAKLWPLAGFARPSEVTRGDSLRMLLEFPNTDFPPGATFAYSNGGYVLLAEIIERVSRTRFEDYIERAVLRPMGMTRSSVLRGAPASDPDIARGYTPQGGGFAVSEDLPLFGGAGGLMLTINDLARYHRDIAITHRVWTPAIDRLMTQAALYPDGSPVILPVTGYHFGYAAGLMLSRDWVLHGGNFAGFQALIAWRPRTTDGFAMLCNRGDLQPPKLATRILAAILPEVPPVDTERYSLPALSGRFVSDDTPAVYQLTGVSGDLHAAVLSTKGVVRSTLTFTRTGDHSYAAADVSLTVDPDQRGFVVKNGPNAARFRRETATEGGHR